MESTSLGDVAAQRERGAPRVALAIGVGILGAAGNAGFRLAIEGATEVFQGLAKPFGRPGIPLALVAGAVVLLALERVSPGDVLGYGFPRFLEMVHLHGARLKRRWIILKVLGSAISLGAGASVGREGPIAQIGGSIAALVARAIRVSPDDRKVLVACGAAAGVASTFNAPIAGVLFAQEIVLLGVANLAHMSLIVVSSATAVAATRELFGVEAVLHVSPLALRSYWECLTFAGLGVILGLLAPAYIRLFHATARFVRGRALNPAIPLLAGMLLVGLIAMAVPKNLSDGYPIMNEALAGEIVWQSALVLALAKIVGSIVSLSSGAPGGVFGPILFIGAMVGASYRALALLLLPGLTGPTGSYALVGLGAFLAATTHAPLAALFLVLEMTESYSMTVPALMGIGAALLVAQRLEPQSIDTYGLAAEGKRLQGETLHQLLDHLQIGTNYRTDFDTVTERTPLPDILRTVSEGGWMTLPVVNHAGELTGVLSFNALREVLLEPGLGGLVVAADICDPNAPTITSDSSLGEAFRRIEAARLESIPVVDRAAPRRVLGMLTRAELIASYNRAVGSLGSLPLDAWLGDNEAAWSHGYRVITVPVPAHWVGASLRALDCRGRWGVTVLAVRPAEPSSTWLVPDPDRALATGDMLVLAGTAESLRDSRENRPGRRVARVG
jgi:CIC family chloride channel protein